MSLAIVIGSEGQGMSRLVSDKCDFYIKIPNGWPCKQFECFGCSKFNDVRSISKKRHDVGEI